MDFSFVDDFSKVRLLVAGEVGIDEYIWGDTRRISPEAPVPVVEVDSQSYKLGLAANVAQNVVSLGAKTTLVTVRGKDADGEKLAGMIADAGVDQSVFIDDETRPTLRKVRIIAQRQHVVRVDYERSHGLDARLAKVFCEKICDGIPGSDGVIVQDYGKGLWNGDTMAFVKQAKAHKKPIFVDPSRNSLLTLYRGATLLTPNIVEAEALCKVPSESPKTAGNNDSRLQMLAKRILEESESEHAIVTCGEWGMVSLSRDGNRWERIPTFARDVFDVTGAGDTVVSVMALMKCLGHDLAKCMQVANAAAGLVVGRIGAASVTPKELKDELERLVGVGLIKG